MTTTEVLLKAGYGSAEEVFQGWALMEAMSRMEQYRAECERFEQKYQQAFEKFQQRVCRQRGQEDFDEEADLEDWAFARSALKWWQSKVEELRLAAHA